jgi:acyl-CoA thioester hydrolase
MNHIFTYPLKVRDYECDAQGHVNNANYQHYFEVARHEFFVQYGFNFFDLTKSGLNLVVARVDIRYKTPMYGSEPFVVTIDKIEKKGVLYIFHQSIIRTTDNMLCAKAKIDVASVVNGKLSRPDFLDNALNEIIN